MAAFANQPAPLARQHGGGLRPRCSFRECFSAVEDLENAAAAVDIFLPQEAYLNRQADSTALGLPAKPPHEVPCETVVQSGHSL
jgi:hypothetical protein